MAEKGGISIMRLDLQKIKDKYNDLMTRWAELDKQKKKDA